MKFLIKICHLFILFSLLSCNKSTSKIDQVNVFIGTSAHGHTFPGSTIPFGMVQLSPDTRIEGWDGCSGYHYSDSIIKKAEPIYNAMGWDLKPIRNDVNQTNLEEWW